MITGAACLSYGPRWVKAEKVLRNSAVRTGTITATAVQLVAVVTPAGGGGGGREQQHELFFYASKPLPQLTESDKTRSLSLPILVTDQHARYTPGHY